jgi:hypothetical protein
MITKFKFSPHHQQSSTTAQVPALSQTTKVGKSPPSDKAKAGHPVPFNGVLHSALAWHGFDNGSGMGDGVSKRVRKCFMV